MSNILQGKEEYFTLIQKYSHYQSVGRMIEYNQIKGKGGERAVSEYVLELKGITKIFPGVKALNNVQFQLKPGEVHALMGENGAGKSTFIKVITGVHKAEEGEMFLNGQKVDFKGPKDAQEAGIAAVYQHPTSYPHLTVAENIFMGHEIIKHHMIQWKEMNQEANKYLKELDADFDATAEMGTLSVAQQQMVEIAKALSTNAKIIILDEPTVGLDPKQINEIRDLIKGLKQKHTVILSSHILSEVSAVCDYVLIISHGKLVASDTPENLGKLAAGSNNLNLLVKGQKDTIRAALEAVEGVKEVTVKKSPEEGVYAITVGTEENMDVREKVFYSMVNASCPILEMQSKKVSLEEIFLELTESEKKDKDASRKKIRKYFL